MVNTMRLFATISALITSIITTVTSVAAPKQPPSPMPTPGFVYREFKDQLPPNFPSLPIYPGAHLETSFNTREGSRVQLHAEWKVGAKVRRVAQWYVDEMIKQGWQIAEQPRDIDDGSEQFIDFKKKGLEVSLIFETEGTPETDISADFPPQEATLYENL